MAEPSAAGRSKHAAIAERLSSRALNKPAAPAAPAFESVDSFIASFSSAKHSIQSRLADPQSSSREELEKVSAAIAELETLISGASYFLPSYEVRSALKSVADLKSLHGKASESLLPRKKFAFKNKPNPKTPPKPSPQPETTQNRPINPSPGFFNEEGKVLVKDFREEQETEGGEFSLCDLCSCTVYIRGKCRALFVRGLKNCRVFAGPVRGAVFVDGVEECLFMIASHQVRIHRSIGSDFYLRVRSRPIVEECRGLKFGPFGLRYDGLEEELGDCGLAEETGNWARVDDFCWLRAAQSPNWCVLSEEQRCNAVDISEI